MDLMVAAISGASVTIVVALAIGYLSIKLSRAQAELTTALVLNERVTGELAIVKAQNNALTDRAQLAEKRLGDADKLISEMGSQLPVDGSYVRLLRAWQIARTVTANAANDNAVRGAGESTAKPTGSADDQLLKPGDDP